MVSWQPLYHDMGLVGLLASALTNGAELVLAAPQDFLVHPSHWMEWISTYGGTITAGPNFSWVLAARGLTRAVDLDLSSLRLALNGAEPVDPDTVETFVRRGAVRLPTRSGVLCLRHGRGGNRRHVSAAWAAWCAARSTGSCSSAKESPNPPTPATSWRAVCPARTARARPGDPICDPATGEVLPDRHVGELEINGTSVTSGYYKRPDVTAAAFRDGWLRTGDLGYLLDGELVLCGRIKDVIIVGGRNVFPEDIERAVGDLDGVRAGNVIAFGVEGYKARESVVVVAEVRGSDTAPLRKAIHRKVLEVTGVPPRDVMLVEPGSLTKTSSGKLQRGVCRDRYLNETLLLVPD
jgi:fatty-acyl-CoA synthase